MRMALTRRNTSPSPPVAATAAAVTGRWKTSEREYLRGGGGGGGVRKRRGVNAPYKGQSQTNTSSNTLVSVGPYSYIVRQPGTVKIPLQERDGEVRCSREQVQHQEDGEKSWQRKRRQASPPCARCSSVGEDRRQLQIDQGETGSPEWISPVTSQQRVVVKKKAEAAWQGAVKTLSPLAAPPQPQTPPHPLRSVESTGHSKLDNQALEQLFTPSPPPQKPQASCQKHAGAGSSAGLSAHGHKGAEEMKDKSWSGTHRRQEQTYRDPLGNPSALHSIVGVHPNHKASAPHRVTRLDKRPSTDSDVSPTGSHVHSNRESLDTLEWGRRLWRGIEKDEHCMYRWLMDRGLLPNEGALALHVFAEYLKNKAERLERDYDELFWFSRHNADALGSQGPRNSPAWIRNEIDTNLQDMEHPYGGPSGATKEQQSRKKRQHMHSLEQTQGNKIPQTDFCVARRTTPQRLASANDMTNSRVRHATFSPHPTTNPSTLPITTKPFRHCATRDISNFYTGRSLADATKTKTTITTTTEKMMTTAQTVTGVKKENSGGVDVMESSGAPGESSPFLSLTSSPERKSSVIRGGGHHESLECKGTPPPILLSLQQELKEHRSPLKAEKEGSRGKTKGESDRVMRKRHVAPSTCVTSADVADSGPPPLLKDARPPPNLLSHPSPLHPDVGDVKDVSTVHRLRGYHKHLEEKRRLLLLHEASSDRMPCNMGIDVLPVMEQENVHQDFQMKDLVANTSESHHPRHSTTRPYEAPVVSKTSPFVQLCHTETSIGEAYGSLHNSLSPMSSPSLDDGHGMTLREVGCGVGDGADQHVGVENTGAALRNQSDVALSQAGAATGAHTPPLQTQRSTSSRYISPGPHEVHNVVPDIETARLIAKSLTQLQRQRQRQEEQQQPLFSPSPWHSPRKGDAKCPVRALPSEANTSPVWSVGSTNQESRVPWSNLRRPSTGPPIRSPPFQHESPNGPGREMHTAFVRSSAAGRLSTPLVTPLPDRPEVNRSREKLESTPKAAIPAVAVAVATDERKSMHSNQGAPVGGWGRRHVWEPGSVVLNRCCDTEEKGKVKEEEEETFPDHGSTNMRRQEHEEQQQQQREGTGGRMRFSPSGGGSRTSSGMVPFHVTHPSSWVIDLGENNCTRSNSSTNASGFGGGGLVVVNGGGQKDVFRNNANTLFVQVINEARANNPREEIGNHRGTTHAPRSKRFGLRGVDR